MSPDPVPVPPADPRARRAPRRQRTRRIPLSTERIVDVALEIMAREGYEAVTMRSIAAELGTGPASLYAHLDGKRELDALLVDRMAADIVVPDPDPERWQEQLLQVCRDMRVAMHRHPGVARAVIGYIPTGEEAMLATDRILAILLAGGAAPQAAAWACDLIPLYVTAVAFEESVGRKDLEGPGAEAYFEQVHDYFHALPAARFPHIAALAGELTTGDAEARFEFGVRVILAGVAAVSVAWPAMGGGPAAGAATS